MSFVRVDGARLHYRADGDLRHPCVVLANALGTDLGIWEAQATALSRHFHVLRYDTRGHGRSERGSGPVDLARLGRDVLGLLDALAIPLAHFCGIGLGGLAGQWLAAHHPRRIGKLVLANTSARIGSAEGWTARAAQVRREGMHGLASSAAAMSRSLRHQDPEAYAACCDALAQADLRQQLASIRIETLVIAGQHDAVTPAACSEALCRQIAGARLQTLPASHLSNIEAGPQFTRALAQFLGHARSD